VEVLGFYKAPKRLPAVEKFLEYLCTYLEDNAGSTPEYYVAWDYKTTA
jgi:hypothetical protein